jgi:rod shape-determining protein MreB
MLNNLIKTIQSKLSADIGIDLGTANTLVYLKGKGVLVNEPTVIAINTKTKQIVAVGSGASKMIGRTPKHITTVKPLLNGVISDFDAAQEYLSYFMRRAEEESGKKLVQPRVVIGAPSGITNVERRAIRKAAQNAGARQVVVMEEPLLAGVGVRLPIHDPVGSLVIDMGGGTTDIAVITLGGIFHSRHTTVAGDKLNSDIINFVRDEFRVLIGEKTAERLKIEVASITDLEEDLEYSVQGRDLISGLPRELVITSSDVSQAIRNSIKQLVKEISSVLEITPPELISDLSRRGIIITGGGALLRGLSEYLSNELQMEVHVPDEPLLSVIHGTSIVLENPEPFKPSFVHDDEIPLEI